MPLALDIIHDEHRSLAAVLQGLLQVLREVRAGRMAPDFTLLRAMLDYIATVPEKLHHPKEDEFLYRRLRARTHTLDAVLDRLEAEHVTGRGLILRLSETLEAWAAGEDEGFERFAAAAEGYAEFHWQHMRTEEDEVMPEALRVLGNEDWSVIDAAFRDNADPLVGASTADQCRELFRRVLLLAPPPIGLGPGK